MIDLNRLIADFESALGCPYVTPGTVDWARLSSGVDCSGLFAAAYRHQGASLPHGSNAIARKHTTGMARLTKAGQLRPGSAVFKWQKDGAPAKYTDGLGNWHHIGLVVSISPLRIIHASSVKGKVIADTALKGWTHTALLKAVDYTKGATDMNEITTGTVLQVRASTLRIRASASVSSAIVGSLKKGAQVTSDRKENGWYHLADGTGWISAHYVKVIRKAADTGTDTTDDTAAVAQTVDGDRLTAL